MLAVANWPAITLVNRTQPLILGLPPFVVTMFSLNILVAILLAIAYYKLD